MLFIILYDAHNSEYGMTGVHKIKWRERSQKKPNQLWEHNFTIIFWQHMWSFLFQV